MVNALEGNWVREAQILVVVEYFLVEDASRSSPVSIERGRHGTELFKICFHRTEVALAKLLLYQRFFEAVILARYGIKNLRP